MIENIFAEIEISTRSIEAPWTRLLEDLKFGKFDAIGAIYFTKERTNFIEYSIPYAEGADVILTAKEKSFP